MGGSLTGAGLGALAPAAFFALAPSPIGVPAFLGITAASAGLGALAGGSFDTPSQPKTEFPPIVSTTTGVDEANEAAKKQKQRLAALSAGGQINTSRGGVLTDAPVARASLLGG